MNFLRELRDCKSRKSCLRIVLYSFWHYRASTLTHANHPDVARFSTSNKQLDKVFFGTLRPVKMSNTIGIWLVSCLQRGDLAGWMFTVHGGVAGALLSRGCGGWQVSAATFFHIKFRSAFGIAEKVRLTVLCAWLLSFLIALSGHVFSDCLILRWYIQ